MCFVLMTWEVKAFDFKEGTFLTGEYINKVKDGKTYYMTVQYIYRDDGQAMYCLEPFEKFLTGSGYIGYNFNDEKVKYIKAFLSLKKPEYGNFTYDKRFFAANERLGFFAFNRRKRAPK